MIYLDITTLNYYNVDIQKQYRNRSDLSELLHNITDKEVPMRNKNIIRICLCVAGIALITAGLMQGDFTSTWNKAIRVCLECIGIG